MVRARVLVPQFNSDGDVIDLEKRPLARRDEIQAGGAVNYSTVPAGSVFVLSKSGGVWPGVPSTRTDLVYIWKGADPSPPLVYSRVLNQPGILDNVDIRMIIGS